MYLATNDLLVPADAVKDHVEPVNTAGWSEVCKGLYGILAGYLLIFGSIFGAIVMVVVAIAQLAAAHNKGEGTGGAVATLIVGAIVVVLLILGGYAVIIRSQWRCLRNASEQCGAKWWMFAAMLCIVAGPALGTTVSLVGDNGERAKVVAMANKSGAPLTFREALAESRKAGASAAPMQIISSLVGVLSQVFFVLFLRSVALSFNDSFRARFVEMYLLLTALLFAGLVGLILRPEYFLNQPLLLLFLGGGTVLSGVWYFVLIISTCACIHKNLALLRARP